jgi:hypothetical protein
MADDIKTSFFDFIKERTSTPLWANYILSWIIFNWHVLIWVFFSGVGDAQSVINNLSKHDFWIFTPILVAALMTAAVPAINTILFYSIEWFKIKRINIRNEFSGQRTYSSKEHNEMALSYLRIQEENRSLIREKTNWENSEEDLKKRLYSLDYDFEINKKELNSQIDYSLKLKQKHFIETAENNLKHRLAEYLSSNKNWDFITIEKGRFEIDFDSIEYAYNRVSETEFIFAFIPKSKGQFQIGKEIFRPELVSVKGVRFADIWSFNSSIL